MQLFNSMKRQCDVRLVGWIKRPTEDTQTLNSFLLTHGVCVVSTDDEVLMGWMGDAC
jgi:hypothetical protein